MEPSGTLALTQQMDKFHDLGTPNHIQSHNQAFSPNNSQHAVCRTNDGIHNGGGDHVMNPFASSSMFTGHGRTTALSSSASSSMLPPVNATTIPGMAAPHHLQHQALSASPSSSFSSPHLLMRRPSSPTDSDQPVVSARNILARKISESPIDRNASSVMCNGESPSSLTTGAPSILNATNAENPSRDLLDLDYLSQGQNNKNHCYNNYDDEDMD